ncbi:MAG: DUF2218 domain-containing protein [Halomonas sp.]|nr:DUF2218 domain-containing protein [Halomonas sp.]
MPSTQAVVKTDNPSTNLKKLCRHFSHKTDTEFNDEQGEIRFPFGVVTLEARGEALIIHGQSESEAELERLEQVVASHLVRFASKESLVVEWQRD